MNLKTNSHFYILFWLQSYTFVVLFCFFFFIVFEHKKKKKSFGSAIMYGKESEIYTLPSLESFASCGMVTGVLGLGLGLLREREGERERERVADERGCT